MRLISRILGGADPEARRPEALARRRGEPPKEGLAWLGRRPEAHVGAAFRVAWALLSTIAFRIFDIRASIDGRESIPALGGQIVAAAVHRGWVDPLLIIRAFPLEPRIWFIGGAPNLLDRPWKAWLFSRLGGLLPVWRGGAGMEVHLDAARAVLAAGGRLALYIEGAVAGQPDAVHKARNGTAFLALRTGAPLIPVAVAGTRDLYRGCRVAVRVLPPATCAELLGEEWPGSMPEEGSKAELELARRVTQRLTERIDAELARIYPATVTPPEARRRWAWINRLFG
ncbi:MAG TPA: lysophospholipid acyltransferase family protein [Candidatus Limnocylindrales bacterium]|nr:lysophospholipid acyltransferase family protein [Candidatus Limnocylindrales bacterium]